MEDKIMVKQVFVNYFLKITDPKIFIKDKWYKKPLSGDMLDFLIWYDSVHGHRLESNDTHFRVISYPEPIVDKKIESSYGDFYTKSYKKETVRKQIEIDGSKQNKGVPGTCSRPDIVANIMKLEQDEIDKRNEKHLKEMEFLKRKRDFLKQSEPDDDDL